MSKMERDIELDSESMQGDMSSTQTVRKSIPLKLKKPKIKVKSSKSSKSKKEKKSSSTEHKETSDETKARKSPRKSKSSSAVDPFPKHNKNELDWNQKILAIGEKVQDPMIHICENCTLPVLVYGRLSTCKHVYCLTCAEKSSGQCSRCGDRIERIEPVGIGQIFVCSFGGSRHGISGCRRSYLSQRDLLAHIRHRHQKDGIPHSDADVITKRLDERAQQTASVPYLGGQFIPQNIRPNFAQAPRPRMPVDNRMMQGSMPQREPVFLEGQRMPMMGQFPQTAPTQQYQPINQTGFRSDQAMLQRHYDEVSRTAAVQNQIAAVDQFLASSSVGQFGPPASSRPAPMSLPPNAMQFATSTGQYLQAGMPQQAAMQPQQRVDTNMQPPRIETLQPARLDAGMTMGHVEGVQMGHAPVDSGWQGVPQQDWGASQRGAEMPGGFTTDANRFPRSF